MDKDVREKYYRVVGGLQALEAAAKQSECMPSDNATAAILEAIRLLTTRAQRSAWDWANECTADK